MTPEEIRAIRDEILKRLTVARMKHEAVKSELKALQAVCTHPDAKTRHYVCCGHNESEWSCPDCGMKY